jgi:4-diphosphocytidyl-2-C-methyl-D-erythritol kinase
VRRVEAPAKINLHLEVLGLRADGYHELAMVMQSLDLADTLHLWPSADGQISLSCDDPNLPTDGGNLIVRAAELLRSRVGLPALGARMYLEKRIPIGAGLAGGSSDGAAALVGLDAAWGLGLGSERLLTLAAQLGSDVPFCLVGGSQCCFGRGEILVPAGLEGPPDLAVLLIKHRQASVSTPWAYGRCREMRGDFYLKSEAEFEQRRQALLRGPLRAALQGEGPLPPLRNDLQPVVAAEEKSVGVGLSLLARAEQSLAVAMSGSGPSLFALFADPGAAAAAHGSLAGELEAAGFDAWCCRCIDHGVRLDGSHSPHG